MQKIIIFLIVVLPIAAGVFYRYYNIEEVPRVDISEILNDQTADTDPQTPDQLATTTENGITFTYPSSIDNDYVSTVNWPPELMIAEPTSCIESGATIESGGQTEIINGQNNNYCRTIASEGAAGSIYNQYTYTLMEEIEDNILSLNFSLRFPQCLNYDQPQQNDCLAAQQNFDTTPLIDEIIKTISFPSEDTE